MSEGGDPLLGSVLGGYRLVELLGRGAAGGVYRAEDAAGRDWAVKVVSGESASSQPFLRETTVADRLRHPNVVRVIQSGREGELAFLVLELVSGITLREALIRHGPLPIGDVICLTGQVLDALAATHAAGIVHRDVKPSNILLGHVLQPEGFLALTARLTDFGVALVPGLADLGAGTDRPVIGTPAYMPPEQWDNPSKIDGRADLYALGCTLFEALCGQKAFPGSVETDLPQILYAHRHGPRPDPRALRPVPEELAQFLVALLEADPAKRPGDAGRLAADLRAMACAQATYSHGFSYERLAKPSVRDAPTPARPAAAEPPPGTWTGQPFSPAPSEAGPPPATAGTHSEEASSASPQTLMVSLAALTPKGSADQMLGPYRLGTVLWRDYGSSLYQAHDIVLDADVTVEVLHESVDQDPQVVARFRRQARAGARIHHPNVHKVYAFHPGSTDGGDRPYCVLEPLRGRSLADRITEGPLPFAVALAIAEQALLGLHAIHSCGMLHRDVKPRNLFLQEPPPNPPRPGTPGETAFVVKLLGMHLVKESSDEEPGTWQTQAGAVMGTPTYMAAEAITRGAREADPRSDLYSLGCVLFEMLCGRPPFAASSASELLRLHVESTAPDLRSLRPDAPPELAALVSRLLEKDPDRRPASAADALAALTACADALRSGSTVLPHLPAPTAADSSTTTPSRPSEDHAFSSEMVVSHYAAPIALAYRRYCRQSEPRARLERLFFTVEAAVRYLVTLGICDLLHCLAGHGDDLTLPAHKAFNFLRRPQPMQLGMWLEALRETARVLADHDGRAIRELPEVCSAGGRLDEKILGELVRLRNECIHPDGTIPASSDECETLAREARPLLDEMLEQVRFLLDYPLGFVQKGLDLERHGNAQVYYVHSCMGAGIQDTAGAYHVQTEAVIREDLPFVVAGGTRLLYLWPLLFQRQSPLNERHTLYAFEDLPDRGWPFLTAIRSAALDVREEWRQKLHERPSAGHAWLLAPLRRLQEGAVVPAGLDLARRLMPWRGGSLTGLSLDGRVRLQAPVGRGGFGTIYAGTGPGGEALAVKVLEAASVSPRQFRRFRKEFERLRDLPPHPSIIRCHEHGVLLLDGRVYPWYSMDFALGGDLNGRIQDRRGGLPGQPPWSDDRLRQQVLDEFRQVLAAVGHLHDHQLVHRDLKPSNVLVMGDGSLRLSDFGLTKHLEPSEGSLASGPMTSTGAVMGTRHYMAPEQEKGQAVAETADVYALGILLAELAVGDRPRPNTSVASGSTLQGWRRLGVLPRPLSAFIQRLTAVCPEQRPATARAVTEELDALLARQA